VKHSKTLMTLQQGTLEILVQNNAVRALAHRYKHLFDEFVTMKLEMQRSYEKQTGLPWASDGAVDQGTNNRVPLWKIPGAKIGTNTRFGVLEQVACVADRLNFRLMINTSFWIFLEYNRLSELKETTVQLQDILRTLIAMIDQESYV